MKGKHEVRRMKAELQAAQSALAVEKDRVRSLLRIIQSIGVENESLGGSDIWRTLINAPSPTTTEGAMR